MPLIGNSNSVTMGKQTLYKTSLAIAILTISSITLSQNVGIHTSSPTHKFHVLGNIRFESYSSVPKALLTSLGPTGVLDTLLIPNDSMRLLRADGKWVSAATTDNWGSQTALSSYPLIGHGTLSQPIAISQGNNQNDVLSWNGSQWTITSFPVIALNNNIHPLCGSLVPNSIIKFDGSSPCSSLIFQSGTSIGLNITTPSPSAVLDLNSNNQGFLLPRLSTAQRNAISTPANGTIIFNTDNFCLEQFEAASGTWLTIACPRSCSPCDTCPIPTINSIVGPSSVCAYDTVTYYVNASGADIYQWATPFGWQLLNQHDSLLVNPMPKAGYVQVSACNECGCVTDSISVSILPVPSAPSISGPSTVCSGDLVQFVATPGYSWYIWDVPTPWFVVSGANDDTIIVRIPNSNNNYNRTIRVRGCNPCCSDWSIPLSVAVKAECRFCMSWGTSGDFTEGVRGATRLSDGTIVVVGYTAKGNSGTTDIVVARYSVDGNLMWHKLIDFGGDETGYDAIEGFSNDLYVVGNGSSNTVVAKLDLSTGNIIWAHPFANGPRCRSILKTPAGNKLWLGGITTHSGGDGFYAIFEMDTLGTSLTMVNGGVNDATGTTSRVQKDMIIVSNNSTIGAIVVGGGQTISCLNVFQCGGNLIIHPKTGGNLELWRFTGIHEINGIAQDPTDGHFVVVGTTATDYKIWVAKIDSSYTPGSTANLNILWQKIISTGNAVHGGYDIAIVNNDIWVLGHDSLGGARSDMLLTVLDQNGNLKWAKSYGDQGGGGESGRTILPIPGAGAFLIGIKRETNLSDNIFVVRVDANGNPANSCPSCVTNTTPTIDPGTSTPEIRSKFFGGSGAFNSTSPVTTGTDLQQYSSCP